MAKPAKHENRPGLLPEKKVAERYEVSTRTLIRWDGVEDLNCLRVFIGVAVIALSPRSTSLTATARARPWTTARIGHRTSPEPSAVGSRNFTPPRPDSGGRDEATPPILLEARAPTDSGTASPVAADRDPARSGDRAVEGADRTR